MAKWLVTFSARSPFDPDRGTWQVGIQQAHLERLRKQSHQTPLARIVLVRDVLRDTDALISGWDRPEKENCFVYVGRPNHDWHSLTIEVPPPPDQLFLVFVLPDGTIDFWTWRPRSTSDPRLPEDVKGKILWPMS